MSKGSDRSATTPTLKRAVARAATLRCPRCGSRRTFLRGWFRRYDRCRTCGIRWRREEGFELGTVTINTIVTMFTLLVGMTVGLITTLPDVPVATLILVLGAGAVVIPIVIYPFTYTIWLALDLAVHPPEPLEIDEARRAVPG